MNVYLDADNYFIPTICLEVPTRMIDVPNIPTGDLAWMRSFQYEDGKLVFRPKRYQELGGEST